MIPKTGDLKPAVSPSLLPIGDGQRKLENPGPIPLGFF
jgi:hypothetical protein